MAFSVISVSLLVLATAAGALAMPPCVCTRELNPVCGTDRQTYSNPCELDCAKSKQAPGSALAVAHFGPCEEVTLLSRMSAPAACPCPRIFSPVCGSDSRTYVNPCELNCAKTKGLSPRGDALAVAHHGPCLGVSMQSRILDQDLAAPIVCPCPRIFSPVCGTDARTYGNQCELNCAKKHGSSGKGGDLAVAHAGPCEEISLRSAILEPASTPCRCPRIFVPICGTDARTYGNNCEFECAKTNGLSSKGNDLAVAHAGPCEETSAGIQLLSNVADHEQVQPLPKACLCPFIFKPVCGTDSVTYPSECTLGCSRDMGTSTKGADLRVAHSGAC